MSAGGKAPGSVYKAYFSRLENALIATYNPILAQLFYFTSPTYTVFYHSV